MNKAQEIEFRRLQVMFFAGMVEYPNDKERMEAGMKVLINFINAVVNQECSKIVSRSAELRLGGQLKGKGGTA